MTEIALFWTFYIFIDLQLFSVSFGSRTSERYGNSRSRYT